MDIDRESNYYQLRQEHEKDGLVTENDESGQERRSKGLPHEIPYSSYDRPAHVGSRQRSTGFRQGVNEAWALEWLSLLLSGLTLTAIIVVLHHFSGREQPNWHSISLNTLISFLSTIAEATALLPIATSLGQMKWAWFSSQPRALSELSAFDDAGRGIIGSIRLLVMHRARHFASFACLAIILDLGFAPFIQNLIHTYPKLVAEEGQPAMLANTYNYTAAAVGFQFNRMVDPVLKSNVYDSLLNPDYAQPWAIPKYHCASANCSWTDVTSFHVQSHCIDLTPQIVTSCNSSALNCTVGVNGGPSLTYAVGFDTSDEFSSPATSISMNISNIGSEAVSGGSLPTIEYVRALNVPNIFDYTGFPITNKTSFVATSCSFAICAQLANVSISDSVYSEEVRSTFCHGSYPQPSDTFAQNSNKTQYRLRPDWVSEDSNKIVDLTVGVWSYLAIYDFLSELFDGYIVLNFGGAATVSLETPDDRSAFYATIDILQAVYKGDISRCGLGIDHLVCAATNVAKAMSKSFRDSAYINYGAGKQPEAGKSNGKVASGDTYVVATFVRIDWWWLALPVAVWILGALTLAGTVWRSRIAGVPGWRDNLLPLLLLYDDKGEAEHRPVTNVRSNQAWEEWAEETVVQLSVDRDGAALK